MSASAPQWEYITTRKDARVLQTFTCTTDLPLTEGGRKMPHPRPWEWWDSGPPTPLIATVACRRFTADWAGRIRRNRVRGIP